MITASKGMETLREEWGVRTPPTATGCARFGLGHTGTRMIKSGGTRLGQHFYKVYIVSGSASDAIPDRDSERKKKGNRSAHTRVRTTNEPHE